MTRVLVIEDEPIIRNNVSDILSGEGFEVLEAEDGQVGVQIATTLLPDLILCDVMMPHMDGYEVVTTLRKHPSTATIPFIFLTARGTKTDFRQGMVSGANDYLTKPFTMAELLEAVNSQLTKQSAITEKHQLELKQVEERFNQLLCYDATTGLPNQFLLREQFNQLLNGAYRSKPTIATLCICLNQFDRISTVLNASLYQRCLSLLVERFKPWMSSTATVTRIKEHQFLVIVSDQTTSDAIAQTAQAIVDDLIRPLELEEQRIYLSVCVGISVYPQDGTQIEALVKNAEIAARSIPRHKTNSYQFYAADLTTQTLEQLMIESDLRTAWAEANFQVYYQPQIHTQTGRVLGAEALIRCVHPTQGILSPAKFIPLAEETGLIIPLGEWIAKTACQQAQTWHSMGYKNFRIAVNLSSRQFNQPNLEQTIARLLDETGLPPQWLELEITESSVMEDLETAIATLQSLRDRGIRIAMDDFGTGYSSLSYLKRIPLDTLKIDRAFICNVQADPQNREIVKNLIQMAHSLDLKVLAEGVETEAELAYLREQTCDEVQGYFFSRPIPTQEFEAYLETWQGFPTASPPLGNLAIETPCPAE